MAFCANCGTEATGRFCPKCGNAIAGESAEPPPPYTSSMPSAAGIPSNVAALLCYVAGFVTGIIFLVLAPYNKDPFVRFHAMQSIFFSVAYIAAQMLLGATAFILPWGVVGMLMTLLQLAGLAIWILLMVKAFNRERFVLPVIGEMAAKQA